MLSLSNGGELSAQSRRRGRSSVGAHATFLLSPEACGEERATMADGHDGRRLIGYLD